MKRQALLIVPGIASVIGLVLCHLLNQGHVNSVAGALSEGFFCGGGRLDCGRLATHPSSLVLGIPLPVWGFQYFLFALGVSLAVWVHREAERKAWAALGGIVCTLAFVFDLYLGYLMLVEVGVVCIKCLATYALSLVLLLAFHAIDRSIPAAVRWSLLLPSFRRLADPGQPDYYRHVIRFLHVAAFLLVMGVTFAVTLSPYQRLLRQAEQQLQSLVTSVLLRPPTLDMSAFSGQPTLGPASARLHAAVVGDFECAYCRALAKNLEILRKRRPDDIRITFVNFPLHSACNPSVSEDLHPDACWLALAGESLAAQDRFWPYHELVYQEIPYAQVSQARIAREIAGGDHDAAAFERSMTDGSAAAAVARDVALCVAHGIDATPTLVLNGYVIKGAVLPALLSRVVAFMLRDSKPEPDSTAAQAPPGH